jgi:uncharacterized repeat protein (TIGR02543 family)
MMKSFRVQTCISVMALTLLWGFIPPTTCSGVPYDPDEVQSLRAFLQCESMVKGKSNAELLGADLEDPSTWLGVSWVDYDPYVSPDEPRVWLPYKHVLNIDMRASLAGTVEIRGFAYLQLCWIMNAPGTVGKPGQYTTIRVLNNPKLKSVYLDYLEASAVEIGGNPNMVGAHFRSSKIGVLNLSAPGLIYLRGSTLGSPPLSLAAYPELTTLDLDSIENITTLDLTGCPKLEGLSAAYMKNMRAIRLGSMQNLVTVSLCDDWELESLDLRGAPKLNYLGSVDNSSLTNLLVGNNPQLGSVEVTGNSSLASLNLNNLPSLYVLRCYGNEVLKELLVQGDSKLIDMYCQGNALESLDVSGLPSLNNLIATGNELTQFNGAGVQFTNLTLSLNKLQSIAANVMGHQISASAYKGGGYVNLDATWIVEDPAKTAMSFDYQGLPEPWNTKLLRTEGTGLPSGYTWKDRFPVAGDVNAIFYFGAVVTLMSYYATVEDNPWGEWFGTAYPIVPTVGDPIGLMTPLARDGYVFEGWYTDEALTQAWDIEHDVLQGEMILYPNWIPEELPMVVSIKRLDPLSETLTTNSAVYRVQFSEEVSGVDVSDFALNKTGTATGHIARASSNQGVSIDVLVDTISGNGTLRLDVKPSGTQIVDLEGNSLALGYAKGEAYEVGAGDTNALAGFLKDHGIDPSSAGGALGADPDGDGIVNVMEFVLDGDPAVPNAGIKPSAHYRGGGVSSAFDYSYNCTTAASEVYRVYTQYSTDLLSWHDAVSGMDGVTITEQTTAGGKAVTVSFAAGDRKLFVRLCAEPK